MIIDHSNTLEDRRSSSLHSQPDRKRASSIIVFHDRPLPLPEREREREREMSKYEYQLKNYSVLLDGY